MLSSTGEELFQLENDNQMSSQEQLAFHRQQLKQRLGLVAQGKLFSTGIESLIEDSDIADIHISMNTREKTQTMVSIIHVHYKYSVLWVVRADPCIFRVGCTRLKTS